MMKYSGMPWAMWTLFADPFTKNLIGVMGCDEAAAKELQGKDYYHWIFANEPEWQQYQDCLKD